MLRLSAKARSTAAVVALLAPACAIPPGAGTRRGGAGTTDAAADAMPLDPKCVNVECQLLECGAGFLPTRLPGECCPTLCVPDDCSTADCPPVACPTGTHEAASKGTCCKTCVGDVAGSGTCEEGQAGYATFLAQRLSAAEAAACTTDRDCRLVALDNTCGVSCGTPVSVRGAALVLSRADAYAAEHCAECPAPTPCPPVERFAVCIGGSCSAY